MTPEAPPTAVPPLDVTELNTSVSEEHRVPGLASEKGGETPFIVEIIRLDEREGHFTPAARLYVTPAIKELARVLSDDTAQSLLGLLSYLRPSGRCEASLADIAATLHISENKARARMDRLTRCTWNESPIIHGRYRPAGLDGYALSSALVTVRVVEGASGAERPLKGLHSIRERVLAHSRATYGRPRAEVERMVAEQLGYAHSTETEPLAKARRAMEVIGVPKEQINILFAGFPLEQITEQIAWLPHRHPREPAKLLVAAIQGQYEPPAYIRLQQAIADEPDASLPPEGAEEAQ